MNSSHPEHFLELIETPLYRNRPDEMPEDLCRDNCLVQCMTSLSTETLLVRVARCMPGMLSSMTLRPLGALQLVIYLEQHPRKCPPDMTLAAHMTQCLGTWPVGANWRHLHTLERLYRAAPMPGLTLDHLAFDTAFTLYVEALMRRRAGCARCLCGQPLLRCLWRMQSLGALYGAMEQTRAVWQRVGARWLCARVQATVQRREQLLSNQPSDDSASLSFGSDDDTVVDDSMY
jgi:hypothetical protein